MMSFLTSAPAKSVILQERWSPMKWCTVALTGFLNYWNYFREIYNTGLLICNEKWSAVETKWTPILQKNKKQNTISQ